MPQKNENIPPNNENLEDYIPLHEEEIDPVELLGTIRPIYDKDGHVVGSEAFL